MTVNGLMDFDSYLEYEIVVTATKEVALADIVLMVKPSHETAQMMCTFASSFVEGERRDCFPRDRAWRYLYLLICGVC